MSRIALLHFSAHPAVGGIETIIEAQRIALRRAGHSVRLVVGTGGSGDVIRVPHLDPRRPRPEGWPEDILPPPDHPLVLDTVRELRNALAGCDQCWVHNALTVYLNPFLTAALHAMIGRTPGIGWAVWCEDLSSASAFVRAPFQPPAPGPARYVTISAYRRQQVAGLLGLEERDITVIRPPLDAAWLPVGRQTTELLTRVDLLTPQPVILVPSKLLPHKGLDIAIRVAAHLPGSLTIITGAESPHQPEVSRRVGETLRTLIRESGASVILLPNVLGEEPLRDTVRDLMLLADVVFLPSIEEGFGMPVQEAAALRVPLVLSDIPPFREAGGNAAVYVDPMSDPAGIAAHLIALATTPTQQARRAAIRSGVDFDAALRRLVNDVNEMRAARPQGVS